MFDHEGYSGEKAKTAWAVAAAVAAGLAVYAAANVEIGRKPVHVPQDARRASWHVQDEKAFDVPTPEVAAVDCGSTSTLLGGEVPNPKTVRMTKLGSRVICSGIYDGYPIIRTKTNKE